MNDTIKKLKEVNKELLNKFGNESYIIRCEIANIANEIYKKERLKQLNMHDVSSRTKIN